MLATICPSYPSTILLGDFNIHVDSANCPFASDFMSLLDCLGIAQHVLDPTHTKGHTLDLVCSTGISPCHLQCDDLAISDHLAISFSVPGPLPSQPSKLTITFRKTKQVRIPVVFHPSDPPDSFLPAWTTATPSSLVSPLKPWTDCNVCRTQLPGS